MGQRAKADEPVQPEEIEVENFIPFSSPEPTKFAQPFKEFDVDKMVERAEKFSDVPLLKKRTRRFDDEVAPELVNVRDAKLKNYRFKRFKLDTDEEEEPDD